MPTTWNPSDLTNITLSGGNLTATSTGQGAVRSIAAVAAGKVYFELTFTSGGTQSQTACGLANGAASLATSITTGVGCILCNGNGTVVINNTTGIGAIGTFAGGGTLCAAVDMGAQLVWLRNGGAGTWNANPAANPTTGVGGFSFSGLTGSLFAYSGGTTGSASPVTGNFGATAFAGAVPSGFTAGLSTSAQATQIALEEWSNPQAPARLTQVAVEEWGSLGVVSGQAVMSQIAMEEWANVAAAVAAQNRVMVMA